MPFDPNAFSEDVRRRKEQQLTAPVVDQSGFSADQFAGDTSGQPQRPEATGGDIARSAGLLAGSAAATAYGLSGPAITPGMAYDAFGRPIIQSGGRLFQEYVADPFRAGRDIAASKIAPGVIPAQVVRGAAPEIAANVENIISRLPKGTDVNFDQFYKGLTNDDKAKFLQMAEKEIAKNPAKGLENAFKNFQAPNYLDDAGRAALQNVQKGFPSGMAKLSTAAGLVGRTAARFAGPVGMAVTAYDLYNLGSEMYDRYKQNQPVAPVQPGTAAAPPMTAPAPVAPAGTTNFDMDRRIREEAYRRALGQQ